jgi:hypothetical protein
VCVCARLYAAAAASHQSSLIVARLFSTLSPQKSSPSSALPLLFLRCARDDEIDGRSVCIPPAESIIVARSSRSSQCLLFCFSFLVCVQFFAQNTHTHTDVILLFLFFFVSPILFSVLVIGHYCLSLGRPWFFIALLWSPNRPTGSILFFKKKKLLFRW